MRYKVIAGIFTAFVCSSFLIPQKADLTLIEGKWLYKSYDPDMRADTYEKVKDFPHDKGGYEFGKDGALTVKQNSGWCGTPPIHYQAVTGKWKIVNDSVIHIEHRNWRGVVSKNLHIIRLNASEMSFKSYKN